MGQQSKCPGVGPCIEEVALEHGVIEATQRGPRDTAHGALAASSFLQFLSQLPHEKAVVGHNGPVIHRRAHTEARVIFREEGGERERRKEGGREEEKGVGRGKWTDQKGEAGRKARKKGREKRGRKVRREERKEGGSDGERRKGRREGSDGKKGGRVEGEGKKVEPRQGPLLLRPQWTWVGL